MAKNKQKHIIITELKRNVYELDAKSIAFYRNNPCIACEDLLGIRLLDSQKYILQKSWNASHIVWCCSRNFGKSFIGAVFMILKAVLYENQAIYIVSSVGNQSKETFQKIEEIVLRLGKTAASIKSLKDIIQKETKKSPTNKTGFSHDPSSYHVEFYNGSEIFTLNGNPSNNRSKRSSLVFFDEAAFSSDELIAVCEAFATQNMDFITDINDNYNPDIEPRRVPTQLIYASSQDGMDKMFYKHYKNFGKRMLAGDRDYFVCDMICDTAIKTFMNGKPYTPLLTRAKVDAALKANKEKALREYYNKPTQDGGVNQIIKWGTIRRNEKFMLPQLNYNKNNRIALSFDPARTSDNSILSMMNIYNDAESGYCGDIVNCINLIDTASKQKYKLDSNRQIAEVRNTLLTYNGNSPDYEHIEVLLIDQGSGGGGTSTYALLNNWFDSSGREHRGLIDSSHDIYVGYEYKYPDAVNKLRLISPRKFRTQMVDEFIELMNLGVIKFPYEFGGQSTIRLPRGINNTTGEEEFELYELSQEEELSLTNIDLMKTEITSIYKFENPEKTTKTYSLPKDKEGKMHDDRFYSIIMLAHYLYELRRGQIINKQKPMANLSAIISLARKPQIYG